MYYALSQFSHLLSFSSWSELDGSYATLFKNTVWFSGLKFQP